MAHIHSIKKVFSELKAGSLDVQKLNEKMVYGARPHFRNGRWNKPALNARTLAEYRKQYQRENLPFPEIPLGNYKINPPKEIRVKSHKHILEAPLRAQKIADNMAKMPKMIADWRKNKAEEKHRARKPIDLLLRPTYSQLELKLLEDLKKAKLEGKDKLEATAVKKEKKKKEKKAEESAPAESAPAKEQ